MHRRQYIPHDGVKVSRRDLAQKNRKLREERDALAVHAAALTDAQRRAVAEASKPKGIRKFLGAVKRFANTPVRLPMRGVTKIAMLLAFSSLIVVAVNAQPISSTAKNLATTGAPVNVSNAAAPSGAGKACVTTDATHCTWQTVGTGTGTVTSVAASVPSIMAISGSPITTSGTLAITLASQLQNLIFASPNGSTGLPTFRALVAGDVPTLNQSTTGNATTATALAANGTNCSAGQIALGVDASGNAEGCYTPTSSTVGLGNVTNDAQTKAAIMPNTAPSSGQIPVGNAGGTAYAPATMSGDATMASTGAVTLKNTGAGAGSCTNCSVTFDAQGRETTYSSGTAGASCSTCTTNALQKGNGPNALQDSGLLEPLAGAFQTAVATALNFSPLARSTDAAPSQTNIGSGSAWSQATTNTSGANVALYGGIGRRFYTFVTPNSTGGKTVTITTNGTATTLTEGTNFNCNTLSTTTCATNLATAINANGTLSAKLTATASSAIVYLDPKAVTYEIVIATNAGSAITVTQGADGIIDTRDHNNNIVIGQGASSNNSSNSIVIGQGSTNGSAPTGAIVIGKGVESNGNGTSIIIGGGCTIANSGCQGVVLGNGYSNQAGVTLLGNVGSASNGPSVVIGAVAAANAVFYDLPAGGDFLFMSPSNATSKFVFGNGVTNSGTTTNTIFLGTGGNGSNKAGGSMTMIPGYSTGTGAGGDFNVQTTPSGSSGSTLNTPADRQYVKAKAVTLTESSATAVLTSIGVASGSVTGGTLYYTVEANDGTDFQVLRGQVIFSAVNKGGTLTTTLGTPTEITSVSTGTLTDTITLTTGTNTIIPNINAVSSLTQTVLRATVRVVIDGGTGVVTP